MVSGSSGRWVSPSYCLTAPPSLIGRLPLVKFLQRVIEPPDRVGNPRNMFSSFSLEPPARNSSAGYDFDKEAVMPLATPPSFPGRIDPSFELQVVPAASVWNPIASSTFISSPHLPGFSEISSFPYRERVFFPSSDRLPVFLMGPFSGPSLRSPFPLTFHL